jgi:uncharacterized membrane protein YsdA (DUF1294 family)
LLNLVAWLFAIWLAAAVVMLVLVFVRPATAAFHWTTDVYLTATALFSLLAFGGMAIDKRRAGRNKRRVPELVLHMFELLGGWPGSMLGQRTFRHKTRKLTYQGVFWAIVAVHLALLAWTAYLWWNPPASGSGTAPAEAAEPAGE